MFKIKKAYIVFYNDDAIHFYGCWNRADVKGNDVNNELITTTVDSRFHLSQSFVCLFSVVESRILTYMDSLELFMDVKQEYC